MLPRSFPILRTEHPGHVLLFMQIFFAMVDMAEAVDPFPRQVRGGRAKVLVFGVGGIIKGKADGVDRGHLLRIIPVDLLAVNINIPAHLPQPFYVLLFGPHLFFLLPLM